MEIEQPRGSVIGEVHVPDVRVAVHDAAGTLPLGIEGSEYSAGDKVAVA
jgi:hypothetical protein